MRTLFSSWQGFGIVELLVAFVIVTLGIVGFSTVIPLGMDTLDGLRKERAALFLAGQMMEEIQSRKYEDPELPAGSFGLEESEPRENFDDIDDYNGWRQTPPQYPDGTDLDGTGGIPDYSDFSRTVLVENVDDNNYSGSPVPDGTTASKRVVVTVSSAKISDIVIKWVATREGMELMY